MELQLKEMTVHIVLQSGDEPPTGHPKQDASHEWGYIGASPLTSLRLSVDPRTTDLGFLQLVSNLVCAPWDLLASKKATAVGRILFACFKKGFYLVFSSETILAFLAPSINSLTQSLIKSSWAMISPPQPTPTTIRLLLLYPISNHPHLNTENTIMLLNLKWALSVLAVIALATSALSAPVETSEKELDADQFVQPEMGSGWS
ncbi:hypothetical protein BDK51DRAFT_39928 [Blyttiomyces helicus]|uniref:Uncharacterized protein n=1 Tax=Blyttiomyces helicus TaxID=388810 RepID=A0A4P9W8M0_9FUNG|nr:hypothetical protein BDK51DRAFT_39928 [Blyttiomyces helicus]|eukprot:RKO88881.1 hypothetical protein BDK51DRAFT_39928 [Blyttiomyces helicus]